MPIEISKLSAYFLSADEGNKAVVTVADIDKERWDSLGLGVTLPCENPTREIERNARKVSFFGVKSHRKMTNRIV